MSRLCRDCLWYDKPGWSREQCAQPSIGFNNRTGTRPRNVEPYEERELFGACGPDGRLFMKRWWPLWFWRSLGPKP